MRLLRIRDYPKYINVRGETWRIKFVRKIVGRPKRTVGLCDPGEREITIKLGEGREETFKTFLHECIHAIEAEYDFDIPHTQKNDVVGQLETGLYALICDNIHLFIK